MIYALLDKEVLVKSTFDLSRFSQKIQSLSIPILQYRNKIGSLDEKIEDLLLIRKFYHGELIVNDSIALIAYADGVHLGQEDMKSFDENLEKAVLLVRKKIGQKILGLSTHNRDEILEANDLDLDYIGLGAYRGTETKPEAKVLGREALTLAKLSKHPVGLIGGIKMDDIFSEEITYRVIGSDLYED